jgi:hypothetical protein
MSKLAYGMGLGLVALVTLTGCTLFNLKAKGSDEEMKAGPDEGTQGGLHEANKGKIVFAKSRVAKDAPATFALTDEIRLTEQVYARAFFQKSAKNTLLALADPDNNCKWDNRRNWSFSVSIDGGDELWLENAGMGKDGWAKFTSLLLTDETGSLLPQEKQIVLPQDRSDFRARLAMKLATLGDGEHKLTFTNEAECNGKPSTTMAKGDIRVFVDAEGRNHLAKRIRLAETGMKTQPAEAKRLADAATATFDKMKLLHFRVILDGWEVKRGANDEPVERRTIALSLTEEGGKCTLRTSEIVEQHEGGGKYGAPSFFLARNGGLDMADLDVPCDIDVEK